MTRSPAPEHLPHVHLIGIGGAGMSALARLYLQQGCRVSGSDEQDSPTVRDLAALGATIHIGHDARHTGPASLVVYSSAVPAGNPELIAARQRGIRTLKHAQALGELFHTRRGIAVAGTHGKTTTTSMIAFMLERCGQEPSFQVGGELVDLNTSARWSHGAWMVVEADEFDRRFLEYRPEIAVVTNVEPDHFEYYGTVEAMVGAFGAFLDQVTAGGWIVACGHDARLARLLQDSGREQIIRYGMVSGAAPPPPEWVWWATDVHEWPGGSRFRVHTRLPQAPAATTAEVELQIPGRHHILNALAALAACDLVGVPLAAGAVPLCAFHGTRRRFQLAGTAAGIRVYEDYAHHPTEVRVNLAAARLLVPPDGRLWAVFQPHLYQRTEALFDDFAGAFAAADQVLLTDVYSPSGREPAANYRGSRDLVAAMHHPAATHVPDAATARRRLRDALRPGDLVLVMGAGPINALAYQLVEDLEQATGHGHGAT